MTTIYWSPMTADVKSDQLQFVNVLYEEPVPFLNYTAKKRESPDYLRCPAITETYRNTFVISAPFSFRVDIDPITRQVSATMSQVQCNGLMMDRGTNNSEKNPVALTLPPAYLFYAKDDVTMESRPMMLERPESLDNVNHIPGEFNIGKWRRPVEFAVEVIDLTKPVNVVQGDALFCVKFNTPDKSRVKFERVEMTEKLYMECASMASIKFVRPSLSLEKLYTLAAPYIKFLNRNKE